MIDWHEIYRHFRITGRSDLVVNLIAAGIPVPNLYDPDGPVPPDDAKVRGAIHLKTPKGVVTERVDIIIFREIEVISPVVLDGNGDVVTPSVTVDHGLVCNLLLSGQTRQAKANNDRLDDYFSSGMRTTEDTRNLRKRDTVELYDRGTRVRGTRLKWDREQ